MNRRTMSYRTAALFALGISLVMHLLFVIVSLYGREVVMPPEGHEHPFPLSSNYGLRVMVSFVSTFIIAFITYLLNFWILKRNKKEWTKLVLIIFCTLIVTLILSGISTTAQLSLFEKGSYPHKVILGGMLKDTFISFIVMISSQLIYFNQRRQQMALEYESLKAENMLTKYQVLKSQVDPHFLFNSLNTLNSMIKIDQDKAQEYVQQLSSVFRYTLQSTDVNTLEQELKFTDAYCSLMEIRYGDSLRFDIDVDPKLLQYQIIPLSTQAMVENAIKHNVVSNKYPLTVTIRTVRTGGEEPAVTVSNPIQPKKEAEAGTGIGLTNIAERVRLKWQREIEVDHENGYFTVTIPLIKP